MKPLLQHLLAFALAGTAPLAIAAVSPDEAAQLTSTLTPFGAERAGNADGSIPAWTGVYATPEPDWKPGMRRGDPFADDKPLYSITAKTLAGREAILSEGVKAMFKKYPDTYRIDVYPTRRTAGGPQWINENTAKNALHAKLVSSPSGPVVSGAYGGIPFPIPKSGAEVMWNSLLNWKGESKQSTVQAYSIASDGKPVLTAESREVQQAPYYYKEGSQESFKNDNYVFIRLDTIGPPIRAGEAIVGHQAMDPAEDKVWMYLTGSRRVRKLPNACCDTPTPATSGLASFDELQVFSGRLDRFDWNIVGKRELLIPYNGNRLLVPAKAAAVIGPKHLNPDYVRWELHRVWVVDATLAPGKRHVAPKGRYYIDEDSWMAVLGERYDARGQLWKVLWQVPYVLPEMPGVTSLTYGINDLISDSWFVTGIMNEKTQQMNDRPRQSDTFFNPDALAGEGVR